MSSLLRRALLCATPLLVATHTVSCGSGSVAFDVTVPRSVLDAAEWIEVGAFRSTSCGSLGPMLAAGIPEQGYTSRVAFRVKDGAPSFGDLPRGNYAFGVVARGSDCTVLATGCTEANIADASRVAVQLTASPETRGTCSSDATCRAARCVPTIGAGCSLQLVGAGPLANPLKEAGTLISAPAIAPTRNGFLIAYREVDGEEEGGRLTVLPIDAQGGALQPTRRSLYKRCAGSDEADGAAIALRGEKGWVAISRFPGECNNNDGGVELWEIDTSDPKLVLQAGLSSIPGASVHLSRAHAITALPGSFLLGFVQTDAKLARATPFDTYLLPDSGAVTVASGAVDSWVAASDSTLAVLVLGGESGQPAADGGADGGTPPPEPGDPSLMLRLHAQPVASPLDALPEAASFAGTWGALAIRGGRILVVSDGEEASAPVVLQAFDSVTASAPQLVEAYAFATEGLGKVNYADVAFQGDRAFVAVERTGSISLVGFANATTSPTQFVELPFGREPRLASGVQPVRDGRIAIAASSSRVAVAWTTAKTLTANDPTGGYAVFACGQ